MLFLATVSTYLPIKAPADKPSVPPTAAPIPNPSTAPIPAPIVAPITPALIVMFSKFFFAADFKVCPDYWVYSTVSSTSSFVWFRVIPWAYTTSNYYVAISFIYVTSEVTTSSVFIKLFSSPSLQLKVLSRTTLTVLSLLTLKKSASSSSNFALLARSSALSFEIVDSTGLRLLVYCSLLIIFVFL